MKKKVGIVTFYKNYNYGSALQSFALTNVVNQLGHDAYLIDYYDMEKRYNRKLKAKTYFNRLIHGCLSPKIFLEMIKGKSIASKSVSVRNEEIKNKFNLFEENKQKIFKGDFTQKDKFDYFISGSDQVWKLSVPGLHYLFYLQFTDPKKRISYAASFGSDYIPEFNRGLLKKYLKGMNSISVREDTGVDIVKESINKNVKQVIDPVLLAGKKFWEEKIKDMKNEFQRTEYMVCYFLDPTEWSEEIINRISTERKLEVVWVDSGKNILNREKNIKRPDPLEFVKLINDAELICTDSFHGTAFSIMMETEFMTFDREYEVYNEQKTRLESLLRLFNLEERIMMFGDKIPDNKINFDKTSKVLNERRIESMEFLESSII